MRIVIAGSSGLIGTALVEALRLDGHEVQRLVRREAKAPGECEWDPAAGTVDDAAIAAADAVINLAGASIGDKRLTDEYAEVVLQSRLDASGTLARACARNGVPTLIQASAMGYYGTRGSERLSERSARGNTLLAGIVGAWEEAAEPAVEAGVRVAFLRTGLVLASHGGFAERLLPLIRLGLIRTLGSGDQWVSWITLRDVVRAVQLLLVSDHAGPVNVVAPIAVHNEELIAALARAAGRPRMFKVPAGVLRLLEGPAVEDVLGSQLAMPGVLSRLDFMWEHPDIDTAATWVMAKAGLASPSSQ